jgi:hypothetical protein
VTKAYQILFGRDPRPEEMSAGLEFLSAEPLRAYEERRKKEDAKTDEEKQKDAKKAAKKDDKSGMGEGMMAGVTKPGSGGSDEDKKKLLPVTPLGRYLKVLMSSSEFLFVD